MTDAANQIEIENENTNGGRGSRTATEIIRYLKDGDLESAKTIYGVDGDKLRQYPQLLRVIETHLGCRIHYIKGCQKCKEIYEDY